MKEYTKPQIEITTFLSEASMLVAQSNVNKLNIVKSSEPNVIQLK